MGAQELGRVARQVGDHPIVEAGARIGYAVNGLLHLMIAWLAVALALHIKAGSADQSGALGAYAATGLGKVLLWGFVAGFGLLAVWQLAEIFLVAKSSAKVKAAAKAIVYLTVAGSAGAFAVGRTSRGEQQADDFTAALMRAPGGPALVIAVGLLVLGIGGYHVFKGATKRFLRDLRGKPAQAVVVAGQTGYMAKGIALLAVGGLFCAAGFTHQATKAGGLDSGLRSLLEIPFGPVIVFAVGVGFACYAVYSFARARYAKV